MIYLLYGLEDFLIHREIKEIIKKEEIDEINLNHYDLETHSLKEIIEDAVTISLFGEKKAIIIENSYIFTSSNNKKLPEQPLECLTDYLEHPNPSTILLFIVNKETIDSRKKIVTQLKKVGKVFEFVPLENEVSFVTNMLKPYYMQLSDYSFFINRVGHNLSLLEQEIEKLKIYKNEVLEITRQDILDITCKTVDIDIFTLIEDIVLKNKEKALESYTEMIKLGEEPIKIIIMLANQFRIMYQAKQLLKRGYSEKNIASHLDIHPYRVKLALEKSRKFQEEDLLSYLKQLANLDYEIKSGKMDKNIGLELFILNV